MLWHQVELIDKLYALNFRAPFMLVQGAAEIMKREGTGGSVVSATTQPQSRGTHLLGVCVVLPWRVGQPPLCQPRELRTDCSCCSGGIL